MGYPAGMTPELHATETAPRLLAPAAELVLDALPPVCEGALWLEVGAGGGALTQSLAPRLQEGGARLVAVDGREALLQALGRPPGVKGRVAARLSHLCVARASVDVVVGNLVLGSRAEDPARLAALAGALKPGGQLVVTSLLEGAFEELLDLVIEVCEGQGLHRARAALVDARDDLPGTEALLSAAREAGLEDPTLGVLERALVFPGSAELASDPFVRQVLLASWLRDRPELPPTAFSELRRALEAYFGRGRVTVRVRTAVLRGRIRADGR